MTTSGLSGTGSNAHDQVETIVFPSLHTPEPLQIPALLKRPASAAAPMPAVVVAHGSAGPDSRGPSYSRELNRAGIATLEIDMWAARGLKGALDRPKRPQETLPDVYGAYAWLAARPEFDSERIGILGFSWGGILSMLTATKPYTEHYLGEGRRFAAHAPLYPCCWLYNAAPGFEFASFTGARVFLQCGELDAYDEPDTGETLVRSLEAKAPGLLSVKVYPGATHAFDRSEPAMTVTDPFSHKGKGGEVAFAPNPQAAAEARAATTAFFVEAFGL